MKDSEFLQFIHDRMKFVHKEHELLDNMWRLRKIIDRLKTEEKNLENF